MKRLLWLILLLPMLLGCTQRQLTGICYQRTNGSTWGDQLYVSLSPEEILEARYIPEGSGEQQTLTKIPITPEQWQTLVTYVEQLPLKKAKTIRWGQHELDGADRRTLTLYRDGKATTYQWPDTPEAQQLEMFLQQLLSAEA